MASSPSASSPASAPTLVMGRPANSVGRAGRATELQANFFRAEIKGLNAIYQYDVAILAKRVPADGPRDADAVETDVAPIFAVSTNRAVVRRFLERAGIRGVAYDGRKIAFSAKEVKEENEGMVLRCDREGNEVASGGKGADYTVKFVQAGAMDKTTLAQVVGGVVDSLKEGVAPIINALDVVLGEGNSLRYVERGRTFFSDVGAIDLSGGAQAWRGFYQSVRPTTSGLFVNVDESFSPFWMEGSLMELCKKANNNRLPNNPRDWKRLGKEFHSLKVRHPDSNRSYRVFGFSDRDAEQTKFKNEETGQMVSVADHFLKTYSVRLQYAKLPCVRTSPRGAKKNIDVPIEVLVVCPKQPRKKAMTPQQTSQMIRAAALKPDDRQKSAQKSIERASYNSDATCKAFGLSVQPQMVKIKARILDVPRLEYRGKKIMQPSNGSWNIAKHKLYFGVSVFHWIVVHIDNYMQKQGPMGVNALVQQMVDVGTQSGLVFGGSPPLQFDAPRNCKPEQFETYLAGLIDHRNEEIKKVAGQENHFLQLVVVLKERDETPMYIAIKRVCDLKKGLASQVMLSGKIVRERRLDQYIANVMLKINVKLGGFNVKVLPPSDRKLNAKFLDTPHIVLGADVSHPAPGGGRPSVAAVVGSCDRDAMQFTGELRNQKCRQEIIEDMGDMVIGVYRRWFEKLRCRRTNVGVHAESVIMFRDGVSEGQYQQVMDIELPAIRRAFRDVCHINPKITYVICTKRHHARFFGTAKTSKRDLDRINNIVAGTVIDTDVTSSTRYDFFVNSHAGIQGTNRPSKYTVLIDENDITVDQMQNYIFRLSHGFARCTRSVSMVNSAFYAHLLAMRGRIFIDDEGSDTTSMSSRGGGTDPVIPAAEKFHPDIANRLFFT